MFTQAVFCLERGIKHMLNIYVCRLASTGAEEEKTATKCLRCGSIYIFRKCDENCTKKKRNEEAETRLTEKPETKQRRQKEGWIFCLKVELQQFNICLSTLFYHFLWCYWSFDCIYNLGKQPSMSPAPEEREQRSGSRLESNDNEKDQLQAHSVWFLFPTVKAKEMSPRSKRGESCSFCWGSHSALPVKACESKVSTCFHIN